MVVEYQMAEWGMWYLLDHFSNILTNHEYFFNSVTWKHCFSVLKISKSVSQSVSQSVIQSVNNKVSK